MILRLLDSNQINRRQRASIICQMTRLNNDVYTYIYLYVHRRILLSNLSHTHVADQSSIKINCIEYICTYKHTWMYIFTYVRGSLLSLVLFRHDRNLASQKQETWVKFMQQQGQSINVKQVAKVREKFDAQQPVLLNFWQVFVVQGN